MIISKLKKIIGKIFVLLVSLIGFLILAVIINSLITKTRNSIIYDQVYSSSLDEYKKIQLPNELTAEQEFSRSILGCSHDYKTNSLRCTVSLNKYYATETSPSEEIFILNDYLTGLGWINDYINGETREEIERLLKLGISPSARFSKNIFNGKYHIELYVLFYDETDKRAFDSDYSKKLNRLIDTYYGNGNYLYNIIVHADMIDR